MTGKFATSKAGHDKLKVYVIIKEETEYVYLADGVYKTFSKPKKKSKKHIQIINKSQDENLTKKLLNKERVSDEEIKRAIKIYEGRRTPEEGR